MTKTLSRRTLLRGALATGTAVTVPLPLLDIMLNENGTALAQTGEGIKPLYVTWFFGNGTLPGRWKPASTGAGPNWQLSPQLEPLSNFKSYLTVLSGLENKLVVSGLEHPTGSAGATTGAPLSGNAVRAASIDQIVADVIADGAPYRSLEVGITPATPGGNQDSLHTVSHGGPNARNNAEYDPKEVFERLFLSGAPLPDDGAEEKAKKLATVKRSVLDSVLEDGAALKKRLGANDRQRVEQHLEAIRAIEKRLDTTPGGNSAACNELAAPSTGKDERSEAPPAVNTAMSELSALALACEQTRVLTYMFSLPAAHVYYRHLSSEMNDDFHDIICHGDPGDDSNQPRVETGVLYTMKCLSEFLTKLEETPYGTSNLLENTLIYVTSDTAWGKIHTKAEWPVLLVGKAGGKLNGDEHHHFPSENLSKALFTVAKIMGSNVTELGVDAGRVTSALPGIMI